MRTSRPFATVSYNTEKFLLQVLNDLVKRDAICFYAFIEHYAEEDEKKMHKHLYIVPNGMQETNGIRKLLEEPDPSDPLGRPLKCIEFVPSKFDDWYLYVLHDTGYLASKGQTRKYHYKDEDVRTSDEDSLHERVRTIDYSKYRKTQDFVLSAIRGVPFYEMVAKGQVPAPQFMQWKNLYEYVASHQTHRNDRETHSPAVGVDPQTGEVLEN